MESRTLLPLRWDRIAACAAILGVQGYVVSAAWAQTLSVALPTPTITGLWVAAAPSRLP